MSGSDTTPSPANAADRPGNGADGSGAAGNGADDSGVAGNVAVHEEFEDRFSDYYERALSDDERDRVAAHLEQCPGCRAAYDDFKSAVTALSGLHKMNAPPEFETQVEQTIHRRSAGRFFGRKAFGDRVPFELIAVVVLVLGLIIFAMLRSSPTGSLQVPGDRDSQEPEITPDIKKAVPQPGPLGE